MKIDSIQSNLDSMVLNSRDSTSILSDFNNFDLDRAYYLLYYSIFIFLISNSIGFYLTHDDSAAVLIVGLILPISVSLLSITWTLFEQHYSLPKRFRSLIYVLFYILTGLCIVFSNPQVILLFLFKSTQTENTSSLLLLILFGLGSKYLIKRKKFFLYLSSFFIVTNFALVYYNSTSIYLPILNLCVLFTFTIGTSVEIKEIKETYQIVASEDVSAFRLDQPTTPIEEILFEIHEGIEKILDVSRNTSPGISRLYKKIVRLFKNIIKKIQNTDNIYQPRLELVTKNMDEDDKIYIEQEFFESHMQKQRFSEQPVMQKNVVEYGMNDLSGFLRMIGKEWNFNSFFVAGCTKNPATVIGKYAIKMYGLDDIYSIEDVKLEGFLMELEKNYPENPYHNSLHGADVMCSYLYILTNSLLSNFMNTLEWLAGIIATLSHDVGHPGKNNRFLIMSGHEIALTYNDLSVLENMHSSILFKIASQKDFNIFKELSFEKFTQIRKIIIDMILATDMAKHFDILSYIRTKYNDSSNLNESEIRSDLFRICMKCSDVGHAAKTLELHEKWCLNIIEEFFQQGDLEKERGFPVSMYCDRETTNVAKSQAGFIRNIVLGLFSTTNSILSSNEIEKMCIIQLQNNEKYWESIAKQRNLSTAFKNSEEIEKNQILPLLRKRTTRIGSLPGVHGTQVSNNIDNE